MCNTNDFGYRCERRGRSAYPGFPTFGPNDRRSQVRTALPTAKSSLSLPIFVASLACFACGSGDDEAGSDGQAGGDQNSATAATMNSPSTSFVDGALPGAGTGDGSSTSVDEDSACVATSRETARSIVSVFFMIDISGSMKCPVPDDDPSCEVDPGEPYADVTRWTESSAALKSFFSSPDSAGMWAGIAFFPDNGGDISCNANTYSSPAAEIAPLPDAASAINNAIDNQNPAGNTPTVPALEGALDHARTWAGANPDQQVVVVYATDGYPRGCNGNTIDNAADAAAAALADSPSIQTYVLGMGSNLTDLNQIAQQGGTGQAFFVDTGDNVATQLAETLASIRQTISTGCTFAIPEPPAGQQLDPARVNVRYTTDAGDMVNLAQDPSQGCAEGWQYSSDGNQIELCSETCNAVEADPSIQLEVLFGCRTEEILLE